MLNSVLISTLYLSIASCLSCIAANRLVLNLRGVYYMNHLGGTTVAITNSESDYELGASSQSSERNSTSGVACSHHETVDVVTEAVHYNRYK